MALQLADTAPRSELTKMNQPDQLLTYENINGVGRITLRRPEKYNSLSVDLVEALHQALSEIAGQKVRAVLIDAAGKHFSTGADLADVLAALSAGEASLDALLKRGQDLFSRLESFPLPVVVAVHGLCLAGGLELVLAADVTIAAATAAFGDQHINFGFLPGWGATKRLPSLVGLRRAADLMFSGRKLTAQEALEWGMINAVVPENELSQKSMEYCAQLATRSVSALTAMKKMLRSGIALELDHALAQERQLVISHLRSADGREGLAAFREKRKPIFN